ncbi:MAG TPA: hypothetical protein VHK01_17945 [Lacipirellulaceae bacterium]|nr:hypothetical protein [Lacipirellulaceae bacterium]
MTGNQALFNMIVPIDDYYITVTDAAAVEVLSGDFNNDGAVNAADYVVWRKGSGTTYNQFHYDAWRANVGRTADASLVGTNVPESATLGTIFAAVIVMSCRRCAILFMRARNLCASAA